MTSSKLFIFSSGLVAGTVTSYFATRLVSKDDSDGKASEKRSQEILKWGAPSAGPVERYYDNHVLQYNQAMKIPVWVAEHLTKQQLKGKAQRHQSKFNPDPSISREFSAVNEDYWDSGWSRGHMAPAGDNKCSQKAMDETFYLSNILPQDIKNNGGFWNRFEIYCRELAKRFPDVRIISGPVMMPKTGKDGKKYIKHAVIGDSEVSVPTHLYKVIVVETDSGAQTAMGSFIVPNAPISFEHDLEEYQVPLETLEKRTGLTMVPKLDRGAAKDLCEVTECKLMNKDEFELFILERQMWGARTQERLEKSWAKLEEKNIKASERISWVYDTKKKELEKQAAKKAEESYKV